MADTWAASPRRAASRSPDAFNLSSAVQRFGRLPLDGEVEVIDDSGMVVAVVAMVRFAKAVALLL